MVPSNEPVEMFVYKANAGGYPGATGNTSFASCATDCIKYNWDQSTKSFDWATPSGGGWPAASQNACNTGNWDAVGVYIKLNHKFLTKLFGTTITLTDHAVFRLEPAPTILCP
jgi:hypothetical protein